jgi:chemotaxis protein MotB
MRARSHRYWRRREDHDNLDRWMVSYADFITLLFAFFVVMYAISSVNEGKYRVLSESLGSAFRAAELPVTSRSAPPPAVAPGAPVKPPVDAKQRQAERMKNLADEILEAMAPLVRQGQVSVIETERGVTVEINESVLFPEGQVQLEPGAVRAIQAVAKVIAPTEFPVTIEGHTDNRPIHTPQFPSNWELSAVRATTVLRLVVDSGVAPGRLTAIGYGDQRPVGDNGTAEGRSRNRRVAIQIEAALPSPAGGQTALIVPGAAARPLPATR